MASSMSMTDFTSNTIPARAATPKNAHIVNKHSDAVQQDKKIRFLSLLLLQGVVGMRVGGVRRVAVRPERGWKKQDPKCATEIDMGVMSGVPGAALAKVRKRRYLLPPYSIYFFSFFLRVRRVRPLYARLLSLPCFIRVFLPLDMQCIERECWLRLWPS